jgi:hypothetical protein
MSSNAAAFAAGAGHTYGLLGQGTNNIVDSAKAFQWKPADSASAHFMMVSILPYSAGMGALGSSELITVTFTARAFDTSISAIAKPS